MRLIMIGCEYSGKTTLATAVSRWMIQSMGLTSVRWHNHFVVPHLDRHLVVRAKEGDPYPVPGKRASELNTEEEEKEVLGLSPSLLEKFQRHMIWRHLHPGMYSTGQDNLQINSYYADAVYAPLYYGYGEPNTFADRRQRARAWDAEVMREAPDTVLVLVKASGEVVRQRMRDRPRPRCVLKAPDVDPVLERFQEEFDSSLILRRFALDTTGVPPEDTLREFLEQMWQHLLASDRLRIASRLRQPA